MTTDSGHTDLQRRWHPRLDPTVNLGHILSASIFLLTGATAWATLTSQQAEADRRIARLERLQEDSSRSSNENAVTIARMVEKVDGMQREVTRLVNAIERSMPPPYGGSR